VRVNSAVQNFEEFGKAFQCAKGKPMYPEKSCRVCRFFYRGNQCQLSGVPCAKSRMFYA